MTVHTLLATSAAGYGLKIVALTAERESVPLRLVYTLPTKLLIEYEPLLLPDGKVPLAPLTPFVGIAYIADTIGAYAR